MCAVARCGGRQRWGRAGLGASALQIEASHRNVCSGLAFLPRFLLPQRSRVAEVALGCCRPPLTAATAATNSEAGCAHVEQLVLRQLALHVLSPATLPNRIAVQLPAQLPALHGSADALRALLKAGAGSRYIVTASQTALHHAAVSGSTECMQALLEAGADASALDGEVGSAADLAAAEGHSACLDLLLRAGGGGGSVAAAPHEQSAGSSCNMLAVCNLRLN